MKVKGIVLQIRIGLGFDLYVSTYSNGPYAYDSIGLDLAFDLLSHGEDPFLTCGFPILVDDPTFGFVVVSATQHTPQLIENVVVNTAECLGEKWGQPLT